MDLTNNFIAKNYAKAFYNLYNSNLNDYQINALKDFIIFLNNRKKALFYASLINQPEVVKKILSKYFKDFKLSDIWLKLVDILEVQNRISLLPLVFTNIVEIYNQNQDFYSFTIASTIFLEEDQKQIIYNFLEKQLDKKIKLNFILDQNLIAGIKIFNNQLRWEYSIAKQIDLLKQMH